MIKTLRTLLPLLIGSLLFTACPGKKEPAPPAPSSAAPSAAAPAPAAPAAPSPGSTTEYASPNDAVKGFFDSVNDKKYDAAWNGLSAKSQTKIIGMVAEDEKMDAKDVKEMFDQNKTPIQMGFWNSFRESSKTPEFAPQATYKVLSQNGNEATVELNSGKVKLDIKAFKEANGWKTGYVETFME